MRKQLARIRFCITAAILILAALTAVAGAGEPYDDELYGAVGPMVTAKPVFGAVGSGEDYSDNYYFYVSARSAVKMEFTNSSGAALVGGVYRYQAGHTDDVAVRDTGSWVQTSTLDPGLYYFYVESDVVLAPGTYWARVTGPAVSSVAPVGSWRPKGWADLPEVNETSSKNARTIAPLYDVYGDLGAKDVDWFRFYVTSTSDVWVGTDAGTDCAGYVLNSSLAKVAPTLQYNVVKVRLTPGVYYVKWAILPGFDEGYYVFGVSGSYVTKYPYASMSTPAAPTSVGRSVTFKSYGTISPKHTAGAQPISIKAYRYEGGKYVLKKTVPATIKDYTASTSKYLAVYSLPSAGKWRIRAYHRDAGHLGSYTSYRYVTVK